MNTSPATGGAPGNRRAAWIDEFMREVKALAGPRALPDPAPRGTPLATVAGETVCETLSVIALKQENAALQRRVLELEAELSIYLHPVIDLDDPEVLAELTGGSAEACALAGACDADLAELACCEQSDAIGRAYGALDRALETAAWQYGELDCDRLAECLLRTQRAPLSELESLASVIYSRVSETPGWEAEGNLVGLTYDTADKRFTYIETAAFDNVTSLKQLPADCSPGHYDRVRHVLYRRNLKAYGERDRRTRQYAKPRTRAQPVRYQGAAWHLLQRAGRERRLTEAMP